MWQLSKHPAVLLLISIVSFISCAGAGNSEVKLSGTRGGAGAPEPTMASALVPHRNMIAKRATHTATLLRDGRILLAGGMENNDLILSSAELYDADSLTFTRTGDMSAARAGHTATLLPSGRVLLTGGSNTGAWLSSAELYDPETGHFTAIGNMTATRGGHAAVALRDGRVLIAGGFDGARGVSSAELYDPDRNTLTATGSMSTGRGSLAATLLADGTVLVSGGNANSRDVLASAEIYNSRTGIFFPTGNMSTVRYKHASTLLSDGKVLITGGSDQRDGQGRKASAEIYDPARGAFIPTGSMIAPRYKHTPGALRLQDGRILVAGGSNKVEIYDPRTSSFGEVGKGLGAAYLFTTATLLPNGKVLIAGGYGQGTRARGPVATGNTWLYQP
jgi:hypothetical protein